VNFEDELYHLVREIDAATAAVAAAARDAEQKPLEWRLPGELGTVTVSGGGELTAVTLDTAEMHQYSAAALSRALLQGVQAAEHHAEQRRRAAIAVVVTDRGLS
jgi:DNA-binding protein YbaB